jgi:hypothetical protein
MSDQLALLVDDERPNGSPMVVPVIDGRVRGYCTKAYPGHLRGCPNFGKKTGCPPKAPMLGEIFDMDRPFYLVWNRFDLGAHIERMRGLHPGWSLRQLSCCLYWQAGARKALGREIFRFLADRERLGDRSLGFVRCPEACGVDVTATMRKVGIELEWPPTIYAYQVALVGTLIQEVGS